MITSLHAGLGGAAALVGGDILQYIGATQTNQANVDIANRGTAANMEEAARNRQFQLEMSNTAHQREINDLKRAGLNPILSANAGASTGTGATGSAMQANLQNPVPKLSPYLTNALEAATMLGGLEKQRAETNLIKTQTGKTYQETKNIGPAGDAQNELIKDFILPFMRKAKKGYQTGADFIKETSKDLKQNNGWNPTPMRKRIPKPSTTGQW